MHFHPHLDRGFNIKLKDLLKKNGVWLIYDIIQTERSHEQLYITIPSIRKKKFSNCFIKNLIKSIANILSLNKLEEHI